MSEFSGGDVGKHAERFADADHRYRLDDRIAVGGMGEVWKGFDTVLNRVVAVKLMKLEYADDPTFVARFRDEARNAGSLHHPGVAQVFDFGTAPPAAGGVTPRPYLVMEYCPGEPLNNLLRAGTPLDPAVVADLMAQVAGAVGAAHAKSIVHRDVKPANLIVSPDRRVKVTDFGIARAADGIAHTEDGRVLGTPYYLSPEQARGNTATPASDVYAVGVVAYECLAGKRPFNAESGVATAVAHVRDAVPPLPSSVPPPIASVVMRALAKKPEERYADGAALAMAFRRAAAGVGDPEGERLLAADQSRTQAQTQVVAPTGSTTQVLPAGSGPVTPAPAPAPAAPAARPPAKPKDRSATWIALLLGLLLFAGLAFAGYQWLQNRPADEPVNPVVSQTPTPTPTPTATEPTEAPVETVEVDEANYLGRDVNAVAAELVNLGLLVDRNEQTNPGGETANAVTGLNPTGALEKGATVTITYWGAEPATDEPTPTPTPSPSPTQGATDQVTPQPSPVQPSTSATEGQQ